MTHLTDRELLLEADGELEGEEAAVVRAHLVVCEECRRRQSELTGAMESLRETLARGSVGSGDDERREQLMQRLASSEKSGRSRRVLGWCAVAASLVVAAFLAVPDRRELPLTPRPEITPGATVAITREQVCAAVDRDEPVSVERAVAQQVFADYGIRNPRPRAYELDYLITPALGGAHEARNLWPQPYGGGEWNARVKDALEDRLREMVCTGALSIEAAQQDLSQDWIAAYKRHFQTDRPLLGHLTFAKDRPWGD
jgi:hypothetical protein